MSAESDMEYSDNDGDDYDYYGEQDDCDMETVDHTKQDPEYFQYSCLRVEEVEKLLNESIELLSNSLQITPSLAKVTLHAYEWKAQEIINKYKENAHEVLVYSRVKPKVSLGQAGSSRTSCAICADTPPLHKYSALACGHYFCNDCWSMHFEVQIKQGVSNTIQCMAQNCEVIAPEDFVLSHVTKPLLRERYQQFMFKDHVKSHPQLRFCPGPNCQWIFQAWIKEGARRVECHGCELLTCFSCGAPHHAPTDCATIRRWLTKCVDDSETSNYISAHTKDCPKCQICIEKNGGCNHMQCGGCRHDFCWVCLGDWKTHGTEYYECSRYKEDPNLANDSQHTQAREALKKYLHYYERWENHAQSLKLEEQTLTNLKRRINQKVMAGQGTWIDWQYLWEAAKLLKRCRYTLQYTYPFAYYMEVGPRKELFEYQQAQLEAEIENLSWKVERAETTHRGDLENQMDIAEKRRTTLLKDFLEFNTKDISSSSNV